MRGGQHPEHTPDLRGISRALLWSAQFWVSSPGFWDTPSDQILLSSPLARARSEEIALTQNVAWRFNVYV